MSSSATRFRASISATSRTPRGSVGGVVGNGKVDPELDGSKVVRFDGGAGLLERRLGPVGRSV